jgi:hypothetical protein
MDGVCHLNACRLILCSWMTILNYFGNNIPINESMSGCHREDHPCHRCPGGPFDILGLLHSLLSVIVFLELTNTAVLIEYKPYLSAVCRRSSSKPNPSSVSEKRPWSPRCPHPPGTSYGPHTHVDHQFYPYTDESIMRRKVQQARYRHRRNNNLKILIRVHFHCWEEFQS